MDYANSQSRQAENAAKEAGDRARSAGEGGERTSQGHSALGGLLNGIVQGYQIRQKMLNDAADREDAARKAAIEDQNASAQDIMNRMSLQNAGRPVINGTVTETRPDTSYTAPMNSTPGLADIAPMPADPDRDIAPQGGTLQNAPNLPTYTGVPGGTFVRKPDPSRTVTYTDRQGNKQQYELKTPEEQQADQAAAAQAKFRSTAIPVKDEQGNTLYLPPAEYAQYVYRTGQLKPVATTPTDQQFGAPSSVPQGALAGVLRNTGAGLRQAAGLQSKEGIAANNQDNRLETNAANNQTKTANTDSTNALRKAIADSAQKNANARAANAQSGANARQANRLTATQSAQQQKALQALQAKEDDLQAARVQLKSDIASDATPALQKKTKQGQLATNAYQIQSYQTRKAAVVGAQVPPKSFQDKIAEGTEGPGPDGHVWQKKDGIVYFLK